MSVQHKELAAGRWAKMTLVEQMANIGSEVSRALNWEMKDRGDFCQRAFFRALELIDLTLESQESLPRMREIARVREALVDYFYGSNQFRSSDELWRSYFDHFNYLVRKNL